MGFLDHLFKLKPSDEKMGEGGKGAGGNGEHAGAVPDPGAFLHPKDFGPRGGGGLYPPIRPAAPGPKTPPLPKLGHEIVLTLGDVLSRIPTQLLRAGLHDASRELRFAVDDLSADIARGRAAVPLSKIAALCPDVFAHEIAPGDDTEIRLPLQKLVEQISLLRGRPAGPVAEPAAPEAAPAKDLPPPSEDLSPTPEAVAETPAMSDTPPPPAVEPVAAALPVVHVFTPPPPQIIAEPAAPVPLESHVHHPAPAAADATPPPAIHIHPPPVVRPILVPPPTLFAASAHPPEPPVSSIPSPRVEIAPTPEAPPEQPPRFPQEALQALFMTDETLDLAAVSRHTAALPGVRACALEWRGEKALAGDAPAGFDLAALQATATRLHDARPLPIGALENFTLHGDQAAISIFALPGVLLATLHRPLPPGVRERLAAVAAELARL